MPDPTDGLPEDPPRARTPEPGGEEIDQPLASPDADATPEGEVEAALTTEAALEAAGEAPGTEHTPPAERRESAAGLVAGGIFLSRIIGFVRERAIGYFFGVGAHADVFRVALRAPNLLQNLLGEGTISAAFIPIYSRMLEEGRAEDAGRFAGAVLGLLTALVAVLVTVGVLLAEPLTALLQPGWLDDAAKVAAGELSVNRFDLTVLSIRITFPMTGVLVLSAWALGVLNSHRQVLPALLRARAVERRHHRRRCSSSGFTVFDDPFGIAALDVVPVPALNRLLFAGLWGAAVGGVLQFGVQLPTVIRVMRGFRFSISTKVEGVRAELPRLPPRARRARRLPDLRLHRPPAGRLPRRRCHRRADECAGALHAADLALRDERRRERTARALPPLRRAPRRLPPAHRPLAPADPLHGRSRRPSGTSASASSSSPRSTRRAGSGSTTRGSSTSSSPPSPPASSRRRWGGCCRTRSTPSTTRRRPRRSPSSASPSPSSSAPR